MNLGITLKNYRSFPEEQPARIFLNKGFTALVGVNNSGKSNLLKFFWEFRPLLRQLTSSNGILHQALQGSPRPLELAQTVRDPEEVFCNRNKLGLSIEFDFSQIDSSWFPPSRAIFPSRFVIEVERVTKSWTAKAYEGDNVIPKGALDLDATVLRNNSQPVADLAALYKACQQISQSIYIPAFRNAINVGANEHFYDIQTGQAFIAQWRAWQAGNVKQHSREARRLTGEIRKIFGYDSLEVNAANDNQTLQLYIDGETYMLGELGSGIAQFFMVLANTAIKNPPFVLIDEPELNLHPSLQRDFLGCLASYATEGVVFATHNLGLALAQADRTYSVQRVGHGRSEVHSYGETPRLPEFLGELSFAGYKELGFDKILLVEGVTDLRAIQHFLTFYGKQDQVVLLPLGGNVLINGNRKEELLEVQRICPHVFALIDSEKSSASDLLESPRREFVALCGGLPDPIPCHVLDRRSLENYFTDGAIKAALGAGFSALGPYDAAPKRWKVDNWRIAHEMERKDIEVTDLGEFLDSI